MLAMDKQITNNEEDLLLLHGVNQVFNRKSLKIVTKKEKIMSLGNWKDKIKEAKDNGSTTLDLLNSNITDISPIEDLTSLKWAQGR